MNRKYRVLFLLVLLTVSAFSSFAVVGAGKIAPELSAKLESSTPQDFVRVIVRMEERPFVAASMGEDTVRFLLKEAASKTQAPVLEFCSQRQIDGDVLAYKSFWLANVVFAEIRADAVADLAALPGVSYVYEDFEFTIAPNTRDGGFPAQQPVWDSYAATFAPQVWEMGYKGQGISVAIADTGVDITHPELAGAMGGTPPFHEGYWAEFDENGELVPGSLPRDTDYHGTHVAGSAVGRSTGEHTVGMAPEATLAGVLLLPEGSGTWPQVLGGLQWAAERKFDVINGSFGANVMNEDLAVAVDNLAAAGVVPVFSNGNVTPLDPNLPPGAPGNTPNAIGVGAFDFDGKEASFNRGDIIEYPGYEYDQYTRIKPDISAPGVAIYSANAGGGYRLMDGTSMSSPHVAGAAALLLSANPDLTVKQVKEILYSGTGGHGEEYGWEDIPTKDIHFGWGRLNVLQSMKLVPLPGVAVAVEGTVGGENGGIADAVVAFDGPAHRVFKTDQNGWFAGYLVEGHYTVTAEATGYLSQKREVSLVQTGIPIEIDFLLESAPLGQVVGAVTDASGVPLAGAIVKIAASEIEVETDESGQYLLEIAEGSYTLCFSCAGYFPKEKEITVVPGQAVQADSFLEFGYRTVVGEVSDKKGDPIADVEVRRDGLLLAVTDAAGSYALDLSAGSYTLEFSKVGFIAQFPSVNIEHGRVVEYNVELEFHRGDLQGTVRNLTGDPIVEALVTLPKFGLKTTTDGEGQYGFKEVPVGSWRVSVEKNGHWPQSATVSIDFQKTTRCDFALEPFSNVTAIFRNGFDTPEEQAAWRFINHQPEFSDLMWHFTKLRCVSPSYSAWHGDPETNTYEPLQKVSMVSPAIKLPEFGEVGKIVFSFQMSGQMSAPIHGLVVFVDDLETGGENPVFIHAFNMNEIPWTKVVLDISDFAGKTVAVRFHIMIDLAPPIYTGMFIDDVEIGYIEVPAEASIAGVVGDVDGQPISGAIVTVKELQPAGDVARMSQTVTDSQGRYSLNVPPGGWTVQATNAPDFVSAEQIVYAEPGSVAEADFVLLENMPPTPIAGLVADVSDGTVQLRWKASDDADLAGYYVYRSLDNEHFHLIGTTKDTQFVVTGLQNDHTYFFSVRAVDVYGLEGEGEIIEATPTDLSPKIRAFDVKPRALAKGGSLTARAELDHPADDEALLDVRLEAALGSRIVGDWIYPDQTVGSFETAVEAVDLFGKPWAPNIYQLTLYAKDEAGRTAKSNTINVAILAPLPQALSFLLGSNPFDPAEESQLIEYALPGAGQVQVAVYTLDGHKVRVLVDEGKEAGWHTVFWDGTDSNGRIVLSGMYVIKIEFTDANGETTDLRRHSVVVK